MTPWTVALQAPPSMGFPRQAYWSGKPFPSLGDLPNPGIEPGSPALQANSLPLEPPKKLTNISSFNKFSILHYRELWFAERPLNFGTLEKHKAKARELERI